MTIYLSHDYRSIAVITRGDKHQRAHISHCHANVSAASIRRLERLAERRGFVLPAALTDWWRRVLFTEG